MKKCGKCKIEKELTEFGKNKRSKDGLTNRCKCCVKEYHKEWREANDESCKEYYQKNKERRKEYDKEYNKKRDKEHMKEYHKEYYKNNKKLINERNKKKIEYKKKYYRERRKTDLLYRLKLILRNRTCGAFKNKGYRKNTKTQEMLGVSWEICKAHMERQFTRGMNWDNHGEWHIDHIIPLSSANTEERLKELCHYTNLQPLWAEDNLKKSNNIEGQQNKLRL